VNGIISQAAMVIGVAVVSSGRVATDLATADLWAYAFSSSVFAGVRFILGYFTARRHGWAIWAGVLRVPMLAIYATGMVFGFVDTGGFFTDRDPAMQLSLQVVAMLLLLFEFAAFIFALQAWYASRSPTADR